MRNFEIEDSVLFKLKFFLARIVLFRIFAQILKFTLTPFKGGNLEIRNLKLQITKWRNYCF